MENEPMHFKVYDKNIMISPVLFELITMTSQADFQNDYGGMLFHLDSDSKKKIADKCGLSFSRMNHIITELSSREIIRKIKKGLYQFNPYIIGIGEWKDIYVLRLKWQKYKEVF